MKHITVSRAEMLVGRTSVVICVALLPVMFIVVAAIYCARALLMAWGDCYDEWQDAKAIWREKTGWRS